MNLAAGWLFVVCAVFITVEVLARNFLGFSTQSTTELSGYMLAVGIAWGLGNALADRAHVRIDMFINRLPAGPRQYLHAVALLFLLALAVAMAYGAWYITNESLEFRAADMTGLRTPLAIPQGLWGVGFLVFACMCLVWFARAAVLLARGRGGEVDRLLGSRTYEDEAREVLDALGKGEANVIAVVFLAILVVVMVVAAMLGQSTGPLPIAELLVLIALFCLFFGAGVYVAAVLGVLGLIFGFAFSDRPFWLYLGQMLWNPSSNFLLVAIPLFLLMGEIMLRAGLSEKLYRALNRFLHRMPGGLLHTNIVSCGVFSAVSGSSVATAATMGSVALPYFANTNYSPRWVLGSLAAGGALGNLIPPGITFILYGLLTDTSVGKLYFAALGPSALVLALFIAVIFWHGLGSGRREHARGPAEEGIGRALWDLVPDDAADRHGARHHLRGRRDADRVGGVRRRRRDDLRRDRSPAVLAPRAPGGRGDRAHDGDDRAHPARRLPAQPHPDQHPGAAEARQRRRRAAAPAVGDHADHRRVLPRARHVHGRASP